MRKLEIDEQYEMQQYLCGVNVVPCAPNEKDKLTKTMLLEEGKTSTAGEEFNPPVAVEAPVVGVILEDDVGSTKCPVELVGAPVVRVGRPVVLVERLEDQLKQMTRKKNCAESGKVGEEVAGDNAAILRRINRLARPKRKLTKDGGGDGGQIVSKNGRSKVSSATKSPPLTTPDKSTVRNVVSTAAATSPTEERARDVEPFNGSAIVAPADNELGILIAEVRGKAEDVYDNDTLTDNEAQSARTEESATGATTTLSKAPSESKKTARSSNDAEKQQEKAKVNSKEKITNEVKIDAQKKPSPGKGRKKLKKKHLEGSKISSKKSQNKQALGSCPSEEEGSRLLEPLFELLNQVEQITDDINVDAKKLLSVQNDEKKARKQKESNRSSGGVDDDSSDDGGLVIDTTMADQEQQKKKTKKTSGGKRNNYRIQHKVSGLIPRPLPSMPCLSDGNRQQRPSPKISCGKNGVVFEKKKDSNGVVRSEKLKKISSRSSSSSSASSNSSSCKHSSNSDNSTRGSVIHNSSNPWKLQKIDLNGNPNERAKAFGIAKMVPLKQDKRTSSVGSSGSNSSSSSCNVVDGSSKPRTDLKRKHSPERPTSSASASLEVGHQAPKKFFKRKHNANLESLRKEAKNVVEGSSPSGEKRKEDGVAESTRKSTERLLPGTVVGEKVGKKKAPSPPPPPAKIASSRRTSFEMIEELKKNLGKNGVDVIIPPPPPKQQNGPAPDPWLQEAKRRRSVDVERRRLSEPAIGKDATTAVVPGRRLSVDQGDRARQVDGKDRKKEKKPKKQGYLSQRARNQCEELHRMSRATATVPRKQPAVSSSVTVTPVVVTAPVTAPVPPVVDGCPNADKTAKTDSSNEAGKNMSEKKVSDGVKYSLSFSKKDGQCKTSTMKDGQCKTSTMKDGQCKTTTTTTTTKTTPIDSVKSARKDERNKEAQRKKKSAKKSSNKSRGVVATSSTSPPQESCSAPALNRVDDGAMSNCCPKPAKRTTRPEAGISSQESTAAEKNNRVVTESSTSETSNPPKEPQTTAVYSDISDEDNSPSSTSKKKEPVRPPNFRSNHETSGKGSVNVVKDALTAIQEEAQEKRLAQELPGYNWLEEKIKSGGLSSGKSSKNPSEKKNQNAISQTTKDSKDSSSALHVAANGKQKHITGADEMENYSPNARDGFSSLADKNTSLSGEIVDSNLMKSVVNDNCKSRVVIRNTEAEKNNQVQFNIDGPDNVQLKCGVVNESKSISSEIQSSFNALQSKSDVQHQQLQQKDFVYQLPLHMITDSQMQQLNQRDGVNKIQTADVSGNHQRIDSTIGQSVQSLSTSSKAPFIVSIPHNNINGEHQRINSVQVPPLSTYVPTVSSHALVFSPNPSIQGKTADSGSNIFIPVSISAPIQPSQPVPENCEISQRLCERIKKSQPINPNSLPVNVSLAHQYSNTVSSSVTTTTASSVSASSPRNQLNVSNPTCFAEIRPRNETEHNGQRLSVISELQMNASQNIQNSVVLPISSKESPSAFYNNPLQSNCRMEGSEYSSFRPVGIAFPTTSRGFYSTTVAEKDPTKSSKEEVKQQGCNQYSELKNAPGFVGKPENMYKKSCNNALNVPMSANTSNYQAMTDPKYGQKILFLNPRNFELSTSCKNEMSGQNPVSCLGPNFATKRDFSDNSRSGNIDNNNDSSSNVGTSTNIKHDDPNQCAKTSWNSINTGNSGKEEEKLDCRIREDQKNEMQRDPNNCVKLIQPSRIGTSSDNGKDNQSKDSEGVACIKELLRPQADSSKPQDQTEQFSRNCNPDSDCATALSMYLKKRNVESMPHDNFTTAEDVVFAKMQNTKHNSTLLESRRQIRNSETTGNTQLTKPESLPKEMRVHPIVLNEKNLESEKRLDGSDSDHSRSPFEDELDRRKRELEFLEWLAKIREQEREKLLQLKREKEKMLKIMENSQAFGQQITVRSEENNRSPSLNDSRKRSSNETFYQVPEKQRNTPESVNAAQVTSVAQPHHSTSNLVLSNANNKQPAPNFNFNTLHQSAPNQQRQFAMYPPPPPFPKNDIQMNNKNNISGLGSVVRSTNEPLTLRNMLQQQTTMESINNSQIRQRSPQTKAPCTTCNTIFGNSQRSDGCFIHKQNEVSKSSSKKLNHYPILPKPYTNEMPSGTKATGITGPIISVTNSALLANPMNSDMNIQLVNWSKTHPQTSQMNPPLMDSNYPRQNLQPIPQVMHPIALPPRLPAMPSNTEAMSAPRINANNNNNLVLPKNVPYPPPPAWPSQTNLLHQNSVNSKFPEVGREPVIYSQVQHPQMQQHLFQQQQQQQQQRHQFLQQPQLNSMVSNLHRVPNIPGPPLNANRMPQIPIPTFNYQQANCFNGRPEEQQSWHRTSENGNPPQQPQFPMRIDSIQKPIMPQPVMNLVCFSCRGSAQFMCSDCQQVCYCSAECQAKDWNRHSQQCRNFKKALTGSSQC